MTTPQEGAVHTEQQDIHTPEETTQMLRQILANMSTKDDVAQIRIEIKQSEQRVMDYTDRRVGEAEGKIIGIVRKEDEKVDETIRTLEINEVISTDESRRLQQLGPFPKIA